MRAEELLQSRGSLPSVVVRDLTAEVVSDVSLGNSVHKVRTNGTEEVSVDGAKSATNEVPLVSAVVRKLRVGVLKVGDHDEPVVDSEVRNTVVLDDFSETAHLLSEEGEEGEHSDEESVGNENVGTVTSVEDERFRVEVVGPGRVPGLSGSVGEEVSGPSEELLNDEPSETVDRSILEEFVEVDTRSDLNLLGVGLDLAFSESTGNENFIPSHVSGCGVVLCVRDTPRVVRYEYEGVEEETSGVVDSL